MTDFITALLENEERSRTVLAVLAAITGLLATVFAVVAYHFR